MVYGKQVAYDVSAACLHYRVHLQAHLRSSRTRTDPRFVRESDHCMHRWTETPFSIVMLVAVTSFGRKQWSIVAIYGIILYAPPTPICCRFFGSAQPLPPMAPESLLPSGISTCASSHTETTVVFLKPTVSSRPSLPPSVSHKCLRCGLWRTINDFTYLLTYLLTYMGNVFHIS